MTKWIAALPMYDWPERRAEVDAEWAGLRDRLRAAGIDAPDAITREHGELFEFWQQPDLLIAQTCWGPMEHGLAEHVQVVGQPSYDGVEGGQGELYSSAIVMRGNPAASLPYEATLPRDLLHNTRFAYNSTDSMSGYIGISRDLEALGESIAIFSEQTESGGHRKSIRAVASGEADVAAIDCMSWRLAQLYEPAAQELQVVGWTAWRKGLPFITAKSTPPDVVAALKSVLARV